MNNLQEKEYRLLGDIAPKSFIIKTGQKGDLLVFDKQNGYQRPIRHCKNEKSIFVDEQSEYALVSPIIFESGYLKVRPEEVSTKKFLDAHPSNKANGGNLFEEVNDEMNALEDLEYEDLVVDLKALVREKQKEEDGLFEMQTLAASIKNSYVSVANLSMPELRQEIYKAINANPYAFVQEDGSLSLFDEKSKRKYLALRALADNIIKVSLDGRTLEWSDTKNAITSIPAGVKPTEHLAEFLETDDGIILLDKIMQSI